MPYSRPGPGVYVTNTTGANINHDAPVRIANFVGKAVKQKAPSWQAALADHKVIANNEAFYIIVKGVVMVDAVGGIVKGDPVYINDTTFALQETGGAGLSKFGRCVEIAGERGTPTGKMRVDLDAKDSFV